MVFVGFFAVVVVLRVFVLMRRRGRNGRQGRSGTSSRRTWCFVFRLLVIGDLCFIFPDGRFGCSEVSSLNFTKRVMLCEAVL